LKRGVKPAALFTGLDQSDREDVLSTWLDEHGVEEGWRLSANLVEAGIDAKTLEEVSARLTPGAFSDVLVRVNAQLAAVGEGDDREWLEDLAKENGVRRHVHFVSGLSYSELAACYAHCEIFALPSKGEGFGLVYLEAMACGKPVIGGAHGGAPEVIEDGKTSEQHLIEIEVDEETIHLLTEDQAWEIIRKYEKILEPTGVTPQKRLRRSLYEMYRKDLK